MNLRQAMKVHITELRLALHMRKRAMKHTDEQWRRAAVRLRRAHRLRVWQRWWVDAGVSR